MSMNCSRPLPSAAASVRPSPEKARLEIAWPWSCRVATAAPVTPSHRSRCPSREPRASSRPSRVAASAVIESPHLDMLASGRAAIASTSMVRPSRAPTRSHGEGPGTRSMTLGVASSSGRVGTASGSAGSSTRRTPASSPTTMVSPSLEAATHVSVDDVPVAGGLRNPQSVARNAPEARATPMAESSDAPWTAPTPGSAIRTDSSTVSPVDASGVPGSLASGDAPSRRNVTPVTAASNSLGARSDAPEAASQTRTLRSADPLARRAPSGEHARQSTPCACPVSVRRQACVSASHMRMSRSAPPEAIQRPSGLQTSVRTGAECPRSSASGVVAVPAFHSRTTASSVAAAIVRESGLNARAFTLLPEPLSCAIGVPLAASQRRITPSAPPEASVRASGDTATDSTEPAPVGIVRRSVRMAACSSLHSKRRSMSGMPASPESASACRTASTSPERIASRPARMALA